MTMKSKPGRLARSLRAAISLQTDLRTKVSIWPRRNEHLRSNTAKLSEILREKFSFQFLLLRQRPFLRAASGRFARQHVAHPRAIDILS
jgi:hypothetical protein